jgi:arginase family enzyme
MAAPPTGAPLIEVRSIGDIACNPFDIEETVRTIQDGVAELAARAHRVVTLGGDHTIALPLLREAGAGRGADRAGPLRRAPGHLGHLLRCRLHPRHAVPARR